VNPGLLAAAAAYILWGLFPIYIKLLGDLPPLEIVAHRSWWSLVLVLVVLGVLRRFAWLSDALRQPKTLATLALCSLLLSCNWLLYVWAVSSDRVLDASLGYFINPLINVALGYVVLHERPKPLQWAAVALAALGVLWLALGAGHVPWISLALAVSFGFYGLLRKTGSLGSLEGLTLETLMLAPLALGWIFWLSSQGQGHFGQGELRTDVLLLAAGPFTAIPLLLFAYGARRITLTTLGLLQYLGPSIQFLLGVYVYDEPFDDNRAVGFVLIWLALAVYSVASWRARPQKA
jgi:chloramphenicol-sensitive protein RarD